MADEVVLHRVTPDDWRSHRDLRLRMLREAPDAFYTQYADVAGFDEATWRDRIAGQHHIQARLAGEPVGTVGLWEEPDRPLDAVTLVAMYVVPSARGRGVGDRLVQAVCDEARSRGKGRVLLEVTEGNEPAIRLYERTGFRFDGTRAPLPRQPELEELGMERWLETGLPDGRAGVGG